MLYLTLRLDTDDRRVLEEIDVLQILEVPGSVCSNSYMPMHSRAASP